MHEPQVYRVDNSVLTNSGAEDEASVTCQHSEEYIGPVDRFLPILSKVPTWILANWKGMEGDEAHSVAPGLHSPAATDLRSHPVLGLHSRVAA